MSTINIPTLIAQQYGDKSYYLIDSLNLENVSSDDKLLLDSCLKIVHSTKVDTVKINAINVIIETSWDEKIWVKYNFWVSKNLKTQFKDASEEKFYEKIQAGCLLNTGYYYRLKGQINVALKYYAKSYKIYKKLNIKEGIAYSMNNMGVIYDSQGNFEWALDCYQTSLKIQEEIDDKEGAANSLSNIGELYKMMNEPKKAIVYLEKSLSIQKKIKNNRGISMTLLKIGDIHRVNNDFIKALACFQQSLKISQKEENQFGIATALREIGGVFTNENKYKLALEKYEQSILILEELEDMEELSKGYHSLAITHLDLNNITKAKQFALKSHEFALKIGFTDIVASSAKLLSSIYEKEGDLPNSFKMYKLHVFMRDSIHNAKNEKFLIQKQIQYDYNKKKALDDIENQKRVLLEQNENEKQKLIIYGIALGLVIIVFFLIIVFNRLKVTREQKIIIEETNEELNQINEEILAQRDQIEEQRYDLQKTNEHITSSINYAKRIQDALLKNEEHTNLNLPQHFIFFKPKDIVSGDFYWMLEKEGFLYVAVADCTGHGVPGAFLTMLGTSFLNEVNFTPNILTPGEILDALRNRIVKELSQTGETGENKDGMDISLVRIELNKNHIQWAGANNPLYIFKQNTSEMIVIKGSREPIGYAKKMTPFTNHSLSIEKGDMLYLFTDGFADQFGGPNGKKYGYKKFRELFVLHGNLPLDEQHNLISSEFSNWIKIDKEEQIDDVCIIGVRI